jgi:hypothetical protein
MKITPITENDVENCAQIFIDAYKQLPLNYKWERTKAIQYLKEYLGFPGFTGFVGKVDDKIVAAMFGHTKVWCTNDQLVIDELIVPQDSLEKGYRIKLLNYCEKFYKGKGIEIMTLLTNKFMPAYDSYINNDYTKVDHYIFLFKQI